ncbi:MAG: transcriptional regulator, partial [Egibacteraceae bacterium]
CQLAGWVAADAGLHATAERCYVSGIHAAHAADDAPLVGNIISLLSYLYSNIGNPYAAVLLANTAYTGARHESSATTQALFQERIAWAHARAGELSQTQRALGKADQYYEQHNPADDPNWVYWLNRDEMDVMAGRCYTELHQPRRAGPLLHGALDHYKGDLVRETSLYSSWLAECYVQSEDIDEAARQASRTLILSRRVNSARAKTRVSLIRRRLRPYRHVQAVAEFEELWRQTEQV